MATNLNQILYKQGAFLAERQAAEKAATIEEAKKYTDDSIANLINSAPEALDTLKELAEAIENNQDAIDALEELAGNHRHDNVTHEADGFMSKEDKIYLDGIGTFNDLLAGWDSVAGTSYAQ